MGNHFAVFLKGLQILEFSYKVGLRHGRRPKVLFRVLKRQTAVKSGMEENRGKLLSHRLRMLQQIKILLSAAILIVFMIPGTVGENTAEKITCWDKNTNKTICETAGDCKWSSDAFPKDKKTGCHQCQADSGNMECKHNRTLTCPTLAACGFNDSLPIEECTLDSSVPRIKCFVQKNEVCDTPESCRWNHTAFPTGFHECKYDRKIFTCMPGKSSSRPTCSSYNECGFHGLDTKGHFNCDVCFDSIDPKGLEEETLKKKNIGLSLGILLTLALVAAAVLGGLCCWNRKKKRPRAKTLSQCRYQATRKSSDAADAANTTSSNEIADI
ncbi:uncharacterized protein LOC134441312 [Engraulis encrasicolus]|uniref:uncharacterized protein LOC134441312 n=1 Tax=Engraulis encrasicolus TaxID=184585 RepID=UPI002FCF434B